MEPEEGNYNIAWASVDEGNYIFRESTSTVTFSGISVTNSATAVFGNLPIRISPGCGALVSTGPIPPGIIKLIRQEPKELTTEEIIAKNRKTSRES